MIPGSVLGGSQDPKFVKKLLVRSSDLPEIFVSIAQFVQKLFNIFITTDGHTHTHTHTHDFPTTPIHMWGGGNLTLIKNYLFTHFVKD